MGVQETLDTRGGELGFLLERIVGETGELFEKETVGDGGRGEEDETKGDDEGGSKRKAELGEGAHIKMIAE